MDKYIRANMVFSKFSTDYIEQKKDLPIRPSQMGVLNIITKREGKHTPLMIAELMGVSKPMIAAHIAALEKKGYIYKEFSVCDKRSFYVIPTKAAFDLVESTTKNLNQYLKAIEANLGKDNFTLLVDLLGEAQKTLKNNLSK